VCYFFFVYCGIKCKNGGQGRALNPKSGTGKASLRCCSQIYQDNFEFSLTDLATDSATTASSISKDPHVAAMLVMPSSQWKQFTPKKMQQLKLREFPTRVCGQEKGVSFSDDFFSQQYHDDTNLVRLRSFL